MAAMDHLYEASRVKSFFVLNISLASFGFKRLTRAQVCIDGTAGAALLGRALAVNPRRPEGRAERREGLTARARAPSYNGARPLRCNPVSR
jgi:hypothetical protein